VKKTEAQRRAGGGDNRRYLRRMNVALRPTVRPADGAGAFDEGVAAGLSLPKEFRRLLESGGKASVQRKAQAGRGGVRLDQDRCRPAEDQVPRARAGRLVVPARGGRLQSDPPAQASGGYAMIPAGACSTRPPAAPRLTVCIRAKPACHAVQPVRSQPNPHSSTAC
jgi:hypothetical protein